MVKAHYMKGKSSMVHIEDAMISETARYLNMPTEAYLRLLILQDEMSSIDDSTGALIHANAG